MGIAFLLSRGKWVAGSAPATRDGASYTATTRGVSAGGALPVLLRFQMRPAFSPKTFALISLISLAYPRPSTSCSGLRKLGDASIYHRAVPQSDEPVPHCPHP